MANTIKNSIPFTKMQGCGNDFILLDNRQQIFPESTLATLSRKLCQRRMGIGANGVLLTETSEHASIKMRYFNADGSEGEMCGNGARCLAYYAYQQQMVGTQLSFETLDGYYQAEILPHNQVRLSFPDIPLSVVKLNQIIPDKYRKPWITSHYHYIWSGVPHVVVFNASYQSDIFSIPNDSFTHWGRAFRQDALFMPQGTNINLVEKTEEHHLNIRTYERGVEEETLACGTGATGAAILYSLLNKISPPIDFQAQGGNLSIDFKVDTQNIKGITLTGNALKVYEGVFEPALIPL